MRRGTLASLRPLPANRPVSGGPFTPEASWGRPSPCGIASSDAVAVSTSSGHDLDVRFYRFQGSGDGQEATGRSDFASPETDDPSLHRRAVEHEGAGASRAVPPPDGSALVAWPAQHAGFWAKCDMLYTVSLQRLNWVGGRNGPGRIKVLDEDLNAIRQCVRIALGLDTPPVAVQ